MSEKDYIIIITSANGNEDRITKLIGAKFEANNHDKPLLMSKRIADETLQLLEWNGYTARVEKV